MSAVLGAVLAGGAGSRLGAPKAAAVLAGRPLAAWPLAALRAAGLETVVVAKYDSPLPDLGVAVVHDRFPVRHPLAGVLAALEHAAGRPVLVVGADLPFVSPALLSALAAVDARVVVPRHGGRLHPLCARYSPAVAPALRAALQAQAPLQRTVAALDPHVLGEAELRAFGDPARLLFNVNRPEDLAAAAAEPPPPTPAPPSSRSAPRP